jgi:hypothetical protein
MLITEEQMTAAVQAAEAQPWNRPLGGVTVAAVRYQDRWWLPAPDDSGNYQPAPERLATILDDGEERLRIADDTVHEVDERRRWHVTGRVT